MACLDTAFLIDLQGRGGKEAQARAKAKLGELIHAGEDLSTTRLNVTELWVGIERSMDPARERRAVDALLSPLSILEFDQPSAEVFGRSMAHLMKAGKKTGDMDLLIASIALVNGQVLVTRNVGRFSAVPGLRVESY